MLSCHNCSYYLSNKFLRYYSNDSVSCCPLYSIYGSHKVFKKMWCDDFEYKLRYFFVPKFIKVNVVKMRLKKWNI